MSNTLHVADLHALPPMCRELGVEVPEPIRRGIELLEVARRHAEEPPTGRLLGLTDQAARDRVDDLSLRSHLWSHAAASVGLTPGREQFESQLLAEIRAESFPHLDALIDALRPAFDAPASALMVAAQRYGYSWATTSNEVIDRADEAAAQAWRDTRDALAAIQRPAALRIQITRMFGLEPSVEGMRQYHLRAGRLDEFVSDEFLDFSVLFAAAKNWSWDRSSYLEKARGGSSLDWLTIAKGGLRLNGVEDVREKLAARAKPAAA